MARYVVTTRIEVEAPGLAVAETDVRIALADSVGNAFSTIEGYDILDVEPGALKEDG